MMWQVRRGVGVAIVVGLAVVGCGGESDDATPTSTTTTTQPDESEPAIDLPDELSDASGEIAYVYEVWSAWGTIPYPYMQEQDAGFVAKVRGAAEVIGGLTPPKGFEQEHATLVADLEGLADDAPVPPEELEAVNDRVGVAMQSLPCEVGSAWVGTLSSPELEDYCDG